MGLFIADLLLALAAATACAIGLRSFAAAFICSREGLPYKIYGRTKFLNAGWGGLIGVLAICGGAHFSALPG